MNIQLSFYSCNGLSAEQTRRHAKRPVPLPLLHALPSTQGTPSNDVKHRHNVGCGAQASRATETVVKAGPSTQPPDYSAVDAEPLNRLVMALFRRKMIDALGEDTDAQGYDGIIKLTRRLNTKYGTPRETQVKTVGILKSLFPSWLPFLFAILISRPFSAFACKMNALATAISCTWLMGPLQINDVETDDGTIGKGHGVLVERCRYLEQAGCASICINSCKVPTQEFFAKSMGLPLTMTPNYEDFSCQFAFGKTPSAQSDDAAFKTPCFSQCPTKLRATAGNCPKVQVMDTL